MEIGKFENCYEDAYGGQEHDTPWIIRDTCSTTNGFQRSEDKGVIVSEELKILQYIHCGQCIDEWKSDPEIGHNMSPKDYQSVQVGFTEKGLQVWCKRHERNVLHIDFEGQKHPAVVV